MGADATDAASGQQAAPKIAIITEDAGVGDSLGLLLTSHAYAVEHFPLSSGAAVDCAAVAPDCLIVGQYQPSQPGLRLLIARRARGDRIPAALITNPMSLRDQRTVEGLDGVTVFEKPFDPDTLLGWLARQAAAGRHAQDAAAQPGRQADDA